jgi:SPP1 family predicted phage head-tail adaptor
MQAGKLRHRVTVSTATETSDGRGGTTSEPTVVLRRVPAMVEMLSGRELDRAVQIDPRSRLSVTMRYHAGVTAGQAVVYHSFEGDRNLEIVAPPLVEEKDRAMQLLCGEAAAL